MGRVSRAELAGRTMGEAIVEMIHLMYQKNTARNFLKGLLAVLEKDSESWSK